MLRLGYRRKEAFSLIELLLVTTLLGVLAALILPSGNKISDAWTRHRERLQMTEEKERLFQKLQEDWLRAVCHWDREEDDIQIMEDGTGIILSCRRDDGSHEYVLWHWDGPSSDTTVGDKIYRSQLQEILESSKTLCDQYILNTVTYRSFRKMFPEHTAAENVLPKDLFAHQIVWWHVQYVGEQELTADQTGGDTASNANMLIYEDFPKEFFSWRAWAHGNISLEREPQWLAVTIAILPSSLRPQWEALSPENQKSFLHQHGVFGTKLLPFRDCNDT
jgi:prepilin-type N-terminal cleavage/methylation domain-containing protein